MIVFISDIHIGITSEDVFGHLLNKIKDNVHEPIDAIIFCGDNSEALFCFRTFFKTIRNIFPNETLIGTIGNHDLNPQADGFDSYYKYNKLFPRLFEQYYAEYLDFSKPIIIGDLAFIGNIGWYNYSALNENHLQLPSEYWQKMKYIWKFYPDHLINLRVNDIEFANKCTITIDKKIKEVSKINQVKGIVVCTHHPIFYNDILLQNNYQKDKQYDRISDIFFYHPDMGKTLKQNEKLLYVVSGHIHTKTISTIGHITNYTIGGDYKKPIALLFSTNMRFLEEIEIGNDKNIGNIW